MLLIRTARFASALAFGTGTGLRNLRERLAAHYPGRHRLDVHEKDGWVHARIRVGDEH